MVQRELTTLGIFCKYRHVRQAKGGTGASPGTHPTLETNIGLFSFGNVLYAWIPSPYKTHLSHSLIHQRNIVHSAVSTRVWCSQCYLLETRIDRQENQFNDYNHQLLNTNISWKTQRILYTTTNFLFWKKKS